MSSYNPAVLEVKGPNLVAVTSISKGLLIIECINVHYVAKISNLSFLFPGILLQI